jgi:dipeptidase E
MFLCLYSGGDRRRNEYIDLRVVERIGKRGSITYIPSDSTHPVATSFFEDFKRYYGYYGIKSFKYFCHDRPFRPIDVRRALEADAVYLSGGNTFYFKYSLRRSKIDSKLRSFATKGGTLLGQSAGSILMTPTITTAAVGSIKDENEVGLKDMTGLGLINVLFVPHYEERRNVTAELRRFSSASNGQLLVAAQDGGGIVKSEEALTFVGPVTLFSGGEVLGTTNNR